MKSTSLKTTLVPLFVFCLLSLSQSHAAEGKPATEKFYGKITLINPASKSLTVYNKKRQNETQFSWDNQTAFTAPDKKSIEPSSLEVGQFLAVSYADENGIKKAKSVALRPLPFRKKSNN